MQREITHMSQDRRERKPGRLVGRATAHHEPLQELAVAQGACVPARKRAARNLGTPFEGLVIKDFAGSAEIGSILGWPSSCIVSRVTMTNRTFAKKTFIRGNRAFPHLKKLLRVSLPLVYLSADPARCPSRKLQSAL